MISQTSRTSLISRLRPIIQRTPRRTLIPAPTQNSGPLLERRSDRALPSVSANRRWLRTLPIFAVIMGAALLGILNYEKTTSSVVSSTLYALRTSKQAREILGEQIYFASKIPWISGELNQLHGRIDISYWVKGSRGQGKMRFRSIRSARMTYFQTQEWSLETEDGRIVQLLDSENDPFRRTDS